MQTQNYDEWKDECLSLIRQAERLQAETEIGLHICELMEMTEKFRSGDSYFWGFQEGLERVLDYINKSARQRKVENSPLCASFTISAENEPSLIG